MGLTSGIRLGPYEILSPLGAGGMGEVYRAKDTKLGREVALKVLSEELSTNADGRARFEREARAVAALSHPNILAIFDFGEEEGVSYAVTELLEGQTLRERLSEGPMPLRKAMDTAVQVARGLAAAHDKGICHRDIKPENLFLTRDGQVKILDFGLAKLSPLDAGPLDTESATVSKTAPGRLLGTVGYMSPEQARGRPADARSDIFSFGAVLYEMVSGARAFHGDSAADTLGAILKEEPQPLEEAAPTVSPVLDRIIMRCVEKDPAARFQSARDLAFSLEAMAGLSSTAAGQARALPSGRRRLPPWVWPAVACAFALLAAGAAYVAHLRGARSEVPRFQQLTFRQGSIGRARWRPAGRGALCSAAWDGAPVEVFAALGTEGAEPMPLGVQGNLLAVSSTGELAVQMKPRRWNGFQVGMLARAAPGGGAPREVLDNVQEADWSPDGKDMAVLRQTQASHWVIEYPVGHPLLDTVKPLTGLRLSPDGNRLAVMEGGNLLLVDRTGGKKSLGEISAFQGLAWSAGGGEIRFACGEPAGDTGLWTVTPSGKRRLIYRAAGTFRLHDSGPAGDLLGLVSLHREVMVRPAGEGKERDLSWLDGSVAVDLSSDGKALLLNEHGVAAGAAGAYYLRHVDGSPPVKLGEGQAYDLSWDGTRVLAGAVKSGTPSVSIVPTGAGRPSTVPLMGLDRLLDAWFFPDGQHLLLHGALPGREERFFTVGLEGGTPLPLTPEGTTYFDGQRPISPDGRTVCGISGMLGDLKAMLYPVAGGAARPLPGYEQGDVIADWSGDGRYLFAFRRDQIPAPVVRIEVSTGKREPWRELVPSNTTGTLGIGRVLVTPDGATLAYSYIRHIEDLYLAEGLSQ